MAVKHLKHIRTGREYYEDERGFKQGEYKEWYSNGQMSEHLHYLDDDLHGDCKWWHENGQLLEHCYYMNNVPHGEYKRWHNNGQIYEHCFYMNGELSGEYRTWYANGLLKEHCFYLHDAYHGEYKFYSETDGTCQRIIYVYGNELDIDPTTLSDKDKMVLALKHGIKFL